MPFRARRNLTYKSLRQVLTGFADRNNSITVSDKVQMPTHHAPYTRRWWRYQVNFPIRVIVRKVMKTTIFQGRAFSLSNGGMGMFAGVELKPGDEMCIEFTPPYSLPPLRVEAKIRNRSGYNYGIEFMADNNKQKEGVEQFCQHLSSLVAASADIG